LITYNGGIVGFVMGRIPAKFATLDPIIEGKAGDISLSMRKNWASQIEYTVTELHKRNILWKDAKPDNIIIDEDDNVWLIDFGGGFTEPWVDMELYESCEGDLQALGRIKDKLAVRMRCSRLKMFSFL
jgi:tRNA A-37 threonylcarbamoyl transferase component Bud32